MGEEGRGWQGGSLAKLDKCTRPDPRLASTSRATGSPDSNELGFGLFIKLTKKKGRKKRPISSV